jgi:hypothetical protein
MGRLIQRSLCQVSCQLSEEAAILNLDTGVYYGLDPVGATIWQRIERPASFEEVKAALLSAYELPASRAEQDLGRFLDELAAAGLVEFKNAPFEAVPATSCR